MKEIILIRFSELSLKGKNKKEFINILRRNVNNKLEGLDFTLISQHDKFLIRDMKEDSSIFLEKISEVVGISWFTLAFEFETNRESIKEGVLKLVDGKGWNTFRVSAKNTSEEFKDSMDLTHFVAGNILEETDMKVNLSNYDVDVSVRVEDKTTFIYGEKIRGIEGLPSGSNGKALAFLSGGIDSPVAAFKMMTRGLNVDFITFLSPNVMSEELLYKIRSLAKQVNKYNGRSGRLYIVNFQPARKYIKENLSKESYKVVFLRRLFAQYGEYLSNKHGYSAMITGDSMGQVASQTPENLTAVDSAVQSFISRPLIGMNKNEIISIAREIGTYDISILPGEDMCGECTPSNPVLKSDMELVAKLHEEIKGALDEFETIEADYTEMEKLDV